MSGHKAKLLHCSIAGRNYVGSVDLASEDNYGFIVIDDPRVTIDVECLDIKKFKAWLYEGFASRIDEGTE